MKRKLKSLIAIALCAVGFSAFAAEPEAVQLWKDGPYWATVNVGTSEVQDHPEYGALYKFSDDEAKNAAESLGEGWRLPTKEEFEKLTNATCCTSMWDNDKKGRTFTGVGDYSSNSIFLPAAGSSYGGARIGDGVQGCYWSSTEDDVNYALHLIFSRADPSVDSISRSSRLSVRAVRDTPLPPSVTVDKVESVEPWDSTKGTIKVDYTLGGTDAKTDYKVAFDITAGGETASVTNDAAKLANGAATKEIDTAALFGKEVTDANAKVKVSLIAIKPLGGVQLWKDGPFFAECNLGADTPEGYGILTNFDGAAQAVTNAMGGDWRLPSDGELKMLAGENSGDKVCSNVWTTCNNVVGRRFFGMTSGYEAKSIFLPAAGRDFGSGRGAAGDEGEGYYWSSSEEDADCARYLNFDVYGACVDYIGRSYGVSVRAVRNAGEAGDGSEEVVASDEMEFELGPKGEPGSEPNPWKVGEGVTAWTNGTELVVQGAGSVTNLADVITDWDDIKGGLTAINVTSNGVTGAEAQAFAGIGDPEPVALTLPDGWQGELPDDEGKWYGATVDMDNFVYPLTVRNVAFQQRYPWNGKVDIGFGVTGPAGEKNVAVTVKDGETAVANFTAAVTIPAGGVLAANLVWDADAAGLGDDFKSDNITVEVAFADETPLPGQLWKGGPIWAEVNLGATTPEDYGILTNFNDAAQAVTDALGEGWRLPSYEELYKLAGVGWGDEVCSNVWTTCNDVTGRRFFGMTSGYEDKSIFLPAAGCDWYDGDGRVDVGDQGYYWSSAADGANRAWGIFVSDGNARVGYGVTSWGFSIRAVCDTPPAPVSAKSGAGALDLTVGDRIAQDTETLVVDPAWGEASEATVKLLNGWQRNYNCASNDLWDTTALTPGRYRLAFRAGEGDATVIYGANFWKIDDDWVVFNSSNVTDGATFEADKTYLVLGTNTVTGTLAVTDRAKFEYGEGAGFTGGEVDLAKRFEKKTVEGDLYRIVEKIKGSEDNPWEVGEGVEAWTNGTELVVQGAGSVTSLADVAKDGLTAINVTSNGVTGAEAQAFAGIGDPEPVALTLPDGWQGELPDEEGNWYGATDVTLTAMPLAVKNVTFQQRYPWNGKVDIGFGVTGAAGETNVVVTVRNGETEVTNFAAAVTVPADGVLAANLVWDADAAGLGDDFKSDSITVEVALLPPPPVASDIKAKSEEGWLDLTVGDRIAKDVETLVVDPAWGEASEATVKLLNGWTRTYTSASIDAWQTAALTPGRYRLAFRAGEGDATVIYGANFWKIDDDWVVFNSSNVTDGATFEADKTYLVLGTNTVTGTLAVTDRAKFEYGEGAGFLGGTVADPLPRRYEQKDLEGGLYRIVEKIKGSADNPWDIGDGVEAWTNGTELVVQGAGSVTSLADVAKDGLTAINVTSNGVTGAASDAFQGIDSITLTLPDGWQGELPDDEGNWYGATDVTLTAVPLAVKNVTFQQRYPWNGKVDIGFDATGPAGEKSVVITVKDGETAVANFTAAVTIPEGGVLAANLVWDATTADLAANFKSDDVTVEVAIADGAAPLPGQLWKGGPIWAECNVGATTPEDYGILTNFDNAAQAVTDAMGTEWRVPSDVELEMLAGTNEGDPVCSNVWTTCNGVNGRRFFGMTSGYEDKSIFLPAAGVDLGKGKGREWDVVQGDYWSSVEAEWPDTYARYLVLDDDEFWVGDDVRSIGMSVRAVRDAAPAGPVISAKSEAGTVDLRTAVALDAGEVEVLNVTWSATAWGAESAAESTDIGWTNLTTGATGLLATGLHGPDVAAFDLPKANGEYLLTHSTGDLTSFVTFTVSGYPVGSNPENPWTVGDGAIAWTDGKGNVYFKPPRCTVSRTGLETVTNAMGGASFPVWLVSADDTETNALVMAIGASGAQYKTLGEVLAADEDSCTLFDVEGCVVNYDGMGAAGEMKSDAFLPGVPTNLTANAYRAFGWEFQGWTTNVAVGNILFADQAKIADPQAGDVYDLKAVWKFAPVKVGAKKSDNVTAYVDMNGTLHIDGTGAMKDFTAKNPAPWTDFAADFKAVEVAEGVTRIGNAAFSGLDFETTKTLAFKDDEHVLNLLAFVNADGELNEPAAGVLKVYKSESGMDEPVVAFNCEGGYSQTIIALVSNGYETATMLTLAGFRDLTRSWLIGNAGEAPWSKAMQDLMNQAIAALDAGTNYTEVNNAYKTWRSLVQAQAAKDKKHEIEGADITWRVLDGMLFIEGTGKMPDFTEEPFTAGAPWNERKDDITNATVAAGITSVGDAAFAVCPAFAESSVLFKDPEQVINLGAFAYGSATNVPTVKVEIVTEDGRTLRVIPGGWTDADDPTATYESIAEAIEDGAGSVKAAFTRMTDVGEMAVPPAEVEEIVKTVTDEDGNEIELTAKYENVPTAEGATEGLVSEIENLPLIVDNTGSNITVRVTATNKYEVAGEVVEAMDGAMSNACATAAARLMPGVKIVGFTSSYLDMSAFWSFKVKKGQMLEFTKSIIAHIPMDVYDGMIYSVSRQHQGTTEVIPDFADVVDSDTAEWVKVDTANQELVVKTRKFCEYALGTLEPETSCTVTVGDSGKVMGAADPKSVATNFQIRVTGRVNSFDFAGYCVRAKGEAAGEYAINFRFTRIPGNFDLAKAMVLPGTFTITDEENILEFWRAEDAAAGYPSNGYIHVRLACDPAKGKVKGEKILKLGSKGTVKVSIGATAAKGYVFAGWYEDPGFSKPASFTTGTGKNAKPKDYRNASQTLMASDNVYLFARFVEKTTTADPIAWLRYAGAGYCGADASVLATNEVWYQGVQLPTNGCQVAFGSLSLPTVSVSGLPAGVKFDKTTFRFTGAPTAASTDKKPVFPVKVTIKNKSGATDVLTMNIRVVPLPAWAVGNFDGDIADTFSEDWDSIGVFSATVGKNGAFSSKAKGLDGLSLSFKAKAFDTVDEDDGTLTYRVSAAATYKVGAVKLSRTVQFAITGSDNDLGRIVGEDDEGGFYEGVQRGWSARKDLAMPAFATGSAAPSCTADGLAFKFGKDGKVTVAGTVSGIKVSYASRALPDLLWKLDPDSFTADVPVFVAPKKSAAGFCKTYGITLTVSGGTIVGATAE